VKKTTVILVAIAMVSGAYADIFANFSAGFGIAGNGAAGGLVEPVNGTTVLLQLIGGGGDGLDYEVGDQVFVNGSVSGNDSLLGSLTALVTLGGTDFSDWAATISGVLTAADTPDTWIRVSGIAAGDWVYEQSVSFASLDSSDPLVLPELLFFDNAGAGGAATGSVTVIPEPATFGLMGIAGLGMFLARKKARR